MLVVTAASGWIYSLCAERERFKKNKREKERGDGARPWQMFLILYILHKPPVLTEDLNSEEIMSVY